MLTDKGRLLLSFFCQIVEIVIAKRAMRVANKPIIGISEPTSKPNTNSAPIKPRITPMRCWGQFGSNLDWLQYLVGVISGAHAENTSGLPWDHMKPWCYSYPIGRHSNENRDGM